MDLNELHFLLYVDLEDESNLLRFNKIFPGLIQF